MAGISLINRNMLIKMSCPDCEKVVEVSEIKKETNVDINGKNISFLAPMYKCSVCGSEFQTMEQLEQSLKLAKIINEYGLHFTWDAETEAWITQSDVIPGLVLEDESLNTLIERVRLAATELIELNKLA